MIIYNNDKIDASDDFDFSLKIKMNSQLIRGIHTKKLPQIIMKVCKFTRNTANWLYI